MMNEYHPPVPRRGRCKCPVGSDGRPMFSQMFRVRDIDEPYRPHADPDPYRHIVCCFAGDVCDEKLDGILTCLTWYHPHNFIYALGPCAPDKRIKDWARDHEKSCRYLSTGPIPPEFRDVQAADGLPDGVLDRFTKNLYGWFAGLNGRNVCVILVNDTAKKNNPVGQAMVDACRTLARGWNVTYIDYTDDAADERLRELGETPLWLTHAENARAEILKELERAGGKHQASGPVTLGEAIAAEQPELVRVSCGMEHFMPIGGTWRVDDIRAGEGRHRELTYNETIALMRRTVTNRVHHDDMVFYEV